LKANWYKRKKVSADGHNRYQRSSLCQPLTASVIDAVGEFILIFIEYARRDMSEWKVRPEPLQRKRRNREVRVVAVTCPHWWLSCTKSISV
jgi:hypothetical protein